MFARFKKTKENKKKGFILNKLQQDKNREKQIKKVLQTKKMPIVTLDPLWYNVKEHIHTKTMDAKEKLLNDLLKQQGKLTTDLKEYGLVKKNLMQDILTISQQLNDQGDMTKLNSLDKLHDSIKKTNEKIEAIEQKIEKVEEGIVEANKELVEETMIIGYQYMDGYKQQKDALDQEIDQLRTQLLKKTKERKEWDGQYGQLYNYLHNVIGYENINHIDTEQE